jgi:hypothetical protein
MMVLLQLLKAVKDMGINLHGYPKLDLGEKIEPRGGVFAHCGDAYRWWVLL